MFIFLLISFHITTIHITNNVKVFMENAYFVNDMLRLFQYTDKNLTNFGQHFCKGFRLEEIFYIWGFMQILLWILVNDFL